MISFKIALTCMVLFVMFVILIQSSCYDKVGYEVFTSITTIGLIATLFCAFVSTIWSIWH